MPDTELDDASRTPLPPGGLALVATPIGNMDDFSPRAVATLAGAEVILCEDTRVTQKLLVRHGLSIPLRPLHDHNEDDEIPGILVKLRSGAKVALVSDAGTPLVSDPGFRLVRAVIEAGLPVTGIPGPSAAVLALTLSGLPPHPFMFQGFLPPRAGPRQAAIARIKAMEQAGLSATLIFYEAPHRVAETLAALIEGLGRERPAALARELTKRFEEVRRGTLASLLAGAESDPPRGEVVLLLGPPEDAGQGAEDLDAALLAAMAGMSLRDAAASVALAQGLPRKAVYARALELARENPRTD